MAHLERYELPEAIKHDLIHCALSPAAERKYREHLAQGRFTEAYDIWNQAAENHLALQLKSAKLPRKCQGKGKVPTFKTQTLAALGTRLVETGAATEWSLRLCKLIRKLFRVRIPD